MSLSDQLKKEVAKILKDPWDSRDARIVPEPEDLSLLNDSINLSATILYADLAKSTEMVNTKSKKFSAEIYKCFLGCASKIITNNGGTITAFDGDRIMGVFIGDYKNTEATKTALKINYAVTKIINPAVKVQYPDYTFLVTHGIGIDTGDLLIARTGIRGSNDLVWVGHAANYAAKLATIREGNYSTWITKNVFDKLNAEAKISTQGQSMWESRSSPDYKNSIYRSNYSWSF
jgi:class 3 adenylate cyclase